MLGLATGRFRRKLLPIRPARGRRAMLGAALTGRLSHDDLARYNAVQKAALCRHSAGRRRHRRVRPRDLEAGAVAAS